MKVAIRDHQNKSKGLAEMVRQSPLYDLVELGQPADILLIDHDVTQYYMNIIDAYKNIGARVYLYPHGATAHLAWDGVWPVYEKTDGYLAMSEGQAEVMRMYGYPKPIKVTGWHWCEQKAFQPAKGRKVLYAPIHRLGNGFIHNDVLALNGLVMDWLCGIGVDLTVRYVGELAGIERVNGVTYQRGNADNSITAIDKTDYVVSFGTFAYLAVARGKPTMMYRQEIPYFDGHGEDDIREAETWELYGNYMEYPVRAMESLASANREQTSWRNRFIGDQITVERLERALYA